MRRIAAELAGLEPVARSEQAHPLINMVRLAGLEPATLGLEDRCSIQMSYRRMQFTNKLEQNRLGRPGQTSGASCSLCRIRRQDHITDSHGRGKRI